MRTYLYLCVHSSKRTSYYMLKHHQHKLQMVLSATVASAFGRCILLLRMYLCPSWS